MKKRLSLFCMALVVLLSANLADAQLLNRQGGGLFQQSQFQSVSANLLQPGLPGRLWINSNYADRGLGYEGNYLTLGGKTRLFQDRLDGRWLFEGRIHHSLEDDGGFFANAGIERVFSIPVAKADISVAAFFDYDGDDQQTFSEGFNQLGITGTIKTPFWDLIGNGYFPIGTESYTLGDHTGVNCFVGNNIALQAGIESALRGFDVTLRTRPKQLAFANGTIDIGGYQYNSDIVDSFAGGRVRVGFQVLNGLLISAEVNHDERFDTTGVLSAGWMFGATSSGYGNEWAGLARDLDRTVRNDHIVRFSQDLVLAIDPDTGLPYNVVHANNTATAVTGDGTIENPFATLAEAEAASVAGDVIFVAGGDGTDTGYDTGITLKDDQFLLSEGGTQFLPLPGGTLLQVSGKLGGAKATISNSGGNEVVRLANNNVVGGITIDATGANFGIRGVGINDAVIRDTMISGATLDGIGLSNVTGDFVFTDNMITNNLRDGIFIESVFDSNATFTLTGNDVSNNVFAGIHFENWDASLVQLVNNVTSNNGRNGIEMFNALNGLGAGNDVLISGHTADSNGNDGIRIDTGNGNLAILDSTITNNNGNGLFIRNWVDPLAGDATLIGSTTGNTSVFTGNGTGILIELEGAGLVQDLTITGSTIDSNGRGLLANVEGIGTILNLDVINNNSISNNATEGIRLSVDDSGRINNNIMNDATSPLQMVGNNAIGGGTLAYVLGGTPGQDASVIDSTVQNVNISTTAAGSEGISVDGTENSRIELDVTDSSVLAATAIDINLDNDANQEINRTYFDNVQIFGDTGISGDSEAGTVWDFSLTNSTVQSNGILAGVGETLDRTNPAAYTPYGDTLGDNGILINATGAAAAPFDNLTRITLVNNVIRDFTFNGVNIQSFGDAQVLTQIQANQIINNGPGNDNDTDADGIFETPPSGALPVNPTEAFFFDGLVLQANGNSTLSARLNNNQILNNFQQGIDITTTGQGTVNVIMAGNQLSNDIGGDNTNPAGVIFDQDIVDMTVTNALAGNICIGMTANTFRLGINWTQVGAPVNPRQLLVGLDGASNGFTNADLPLLQVGTVGFGVCDNLVTAEELFFQATGGFPVSSH